MARLRSCVRVLGAGLCPHRPSGRSRGREHNPAGTCMPRSIWLGAAFVFVHIGALRSQVPSLTWGDFASHPARPALERSPLLTNADAKMVALSLLSDAFDPVNLAKDEAFSHYFSSYKDANDEFQRARLVHDIKERFEARQRQLKEIETFTTRLGTTLAEYSFADSGFPFSPPRVNADVTIDNYRDETVFPGLVRLSSSMAELIVRSNPSRHLEVLLVIRPSAGVSFLSPGKAGGLPFLFEGKIVPLSAVALFSVLLIPTTREVIAAYPSQQSVNDQIVSLMRRYEERLGAADGRGIVGNAEIEARLTEEITGLRRGIEDLQNRILEFGWRGRGDVDSIARRIEERARHRRELLLSVLRAGRPLIGQARTIMRSGPVIIGFTEFDSTTARFLGVIERPGQQSRHRIVGELAMDLLGPKLVFDETEVLSGREKLEGGYILRVMESGELVGKFQEGGFGGAINVRLQSAAGKMTETPDGPVGSWNGMVSQPGHEPYPATMRIEATDGGLRGTITYPSLRCGGSLALREVEESKLTFAETIEYGRGRCVDGGVIRVAIKGENTLGWEWLFPDGRVGATGAFDRN